MAKPRRLTPEAGVRYNVSVAHLEVAGMLPAHISAADPSALVVSREDVTGALRWSGRREFICLIQIFYETGLTFPGAQSIDRLVP